MSLAPYRTITVEEWKGIALVTLNRPEELNAFTPLMGRELGHAFTQLDSSESVRAIVVTGQGRAFCVGAALDESGSAFTGGTDIDEAIGPPLSSIKPWQLNTPVLAAINGAAAGVGLTYALQWDIRIVARDAKLAFPFTRRGLIPEANSLWLLSRAIGSSRGLELLLTGRTFTGEEAAEMGIVSRAVATDRVLSTTLDIALELAAKTSPAAVALTKRMFYEQLESMDRDRSMQSERSTFLWMCSQPDAREGIGAFLEKRQPAWSMPKKVPIASEGPET